MRKSENVTDNIEENEAYRLKYGNTTQVLENIKQGENNIKIVKENIKIYKYQQIVYNDKIKVLSENKIHFKRANTENIMDYTWDSDCSTPKKVTHNKNKRITLNKFQWDLMLQDIKY